MKKRISAGLLVVLAFVLSACGATVDTVFKVNQDGSGSRVMNLTVSKSDFDDYVTGGVGAIQGIIDANMPSQMSASAITEKDGKYNLSFTIAFDNPEQYTEKALAILAAGPETSTDYLSTMVLADSPFRSGLTIDENFSSQSLLGWFEDAVEKASIVKDDAGVLESGSTTVEFAGDQQSIYSNNINFNSTASEGLTNVGITTVNLGDDGWQRTFEFEMPTTAYMARKDAIIEYFAAQSVKVEDALTDDTDAVAWTATVTGTPEDVTAVTDSLLSDPNAVFSVTYTAPAAGSIVPHINVVDDFTCAAICSQDVYLSTNLVVPSAWNAAGSSLYASAYGDDDTQVVYSYETAQESIDFSKYFDVTALSFETGFGLGGAVNETVTLNLAGVSPDEAEGLLTSLAGSNEDVEISSKDEGDGQYAFSIGISADSPEAFEQAITTYFPGTTVTISDQGSFFKDHKDISMLMDTSSLFEGTPVAVEPKIDFSAPFMHSVVLPEEDLYPSLDGYLVAVQGTYSGTSVASMIILGVLLLIVVIAVALAIIFRGKISEQMAQRRANRPAPMPAPMAYATTGTPAPAPDAYPSGDFSQGAPVPPESAPKAPPLSESDLI